MNSGSFGLDNIPKKGKKKIKTIQLSMKQIGEVSKEEEDEVNGLNSNGFEDSKHKVWDWVFCTTEKLTKK